MTPLDDIQVMDNLIKDINAILSKHGVKQSICLSDITVTDKTVSDIVKPDAKLSDAIADHLWPSIKLANVYHYTSKEAAEKILNTGIFRLNNIANRYNEGEIVTFCETHQLNGYLKKDNNGEPKYKSLIMPNTFYASFTDTLITNEQEEYFWRNFASSDGVRLEIKITALNHNFRKLRYEESKSSPIKLISELIDCTRINYNREFILKGISRLCSFYLCGKDYGIENEYRILHRAWEDSGPQPIGSGAGSYIEVPLNKMSDFGYKLEVTEVHSVEKPDMTSEYLFSKRQI